MKASEIQFKYNAKSLEGWIVETTEFFGCNPFKTAHF